MPCRCSSSSNRNESEPPANAGGFKTFKEGDAVDYRMCWLEYRGLPADVAKKLKDWFSSVSILEPGSSVLKDEIRRFSERSIGITPGFYSRPLKKEKYIMVGRLESLPIKFDENLGEEGFMLRTLEWNGSKILLVTGETKKALVYGILI